MCGIFVCPRDHILSNVTPYILVGNSYAIYKYIILTSKIHVFSNTYFYLRGVNII